MELSELTVARAAEMVRTRELSPVELVKALLSRIDALDSVVRAWETVDREGALNAARFCQERVGQGEMGPLFGVPLGVKDIFYTAGLRTTSGSSIYRDFVPTYDATAVARLREAGAIVLGKTVTAQFAHRDHPVTRNPWNPSRSPGGSSSGSAAAVASRMVPGALGTQTGGSVLRPAAYCGVVGLKPTYGRISRYGVTPASWSLDHVGVIVRTVEDAALLLQLLAGHDPLDHASSRAPLADYRGAAARRGRPPRLGLVPDFLQYAQPEVAAHLETVARRLEAAGAEVRQVPLPQPMPFLLSIRSLIGQVESAAAHGRLLCQHPEGYEPNIRANVEVGELVPGAVYLHAQRLRRRIRPLVEGMLEGVDCLLMPTVSNLPPEPTTTGPASFQSIWSLFGQPSITLPSGVSADGLPHATQLVAASFREDTLLASAAWCEAALGPMPPCPG